jgi:hypothetical protein
MITKHDLQGADETLAAYPAGSALMRLAELLAPASLIEPELLRHVRLACIPEADVTVEQALWFSELIRSRSDQGVVFGTAVRLNLQRRLQRRLATQRDLVERARSVMGTLHRDQTPLLALEESLAWSEVFGDTQALRAAADTLIESLLAGREGMEHWLTRVWDSLPAPLRHTPAGQNLAQVAAVHGADVDIVAAQDLDVSRVIHLLPLVPVYIRRDNMLLHLGVPAAEATHGIRVPDTRPVVLELFWETNGHRYTEKVVLRARESKTLDVRSGTVSLRTLAGARYEIEPVRTEFALEIEILAAGSGQSLLLTYGGPDDPHRMLVDCGPPSTARTIQHRLDELPLERRRLDLLVISHIDDDHIGGAIRLLENEKSELRCHDIWFNGFRHLEQIGEIIA